MSLAKRVDSVPMSSFHSLCPFPPLGFQILKEISGVGPFGPAGSHESRGLPDPSSSAGHEQGETLLPKDLHVPVSPIPGQEGLSHSESAFLAA